MRPKYSSVRARSAKKAPEAAAGYLAVPHVSFAVMKRSFCYKCSVEVVSDSPSCQSILDSYLKGTWGCTQRR
jgi:hypothetical protein